MVWLLSRPSEMIPQILTYPGWLKKAIQNMQEDNFFTPLSCIDNKKLNQKDIDNIRKSFVDNYILPAIDKYVNTVLGIEVTKDDKRECAFCQNKHNDKCVIMNNGDVYCAHHYTD